MEYGWGINVWHIGLREHTKEEQHSLNELGEHWGVENQSFTTDSLVATTNLLSPSVHWKLRSFLPAVCYGQSRWPDARLGSKQRRNTFLYWLAPSIVKLYKKNQQTTSIHC